MGTATAVIFLVLPSNVVALAGLEKAVLGAPDCFRKLLHTSRTLRAQTSPLCFPGRLGAHHLAVVAHAMFMVAALTQSLAFRALGRWVPRPLIVTRLLHHVLAVPEAPPPAARVRPLDGRE